MGKVQIIQSFPKEFGPEAVCTGKLKLEERTPSGVYLIYLD